MRFTRTANDSAASGGALLPDGEHDCDIIGVADKSSRDGTKEWCVVTLQPVDPQYAQLEKWINPNSEYDVPLATQLADALGIPGEEFDLTSELVGRRVRVIAKGGKSKKDGSDVVYVNGFAAAPQPAAVPVWKQNAEETARRQAKRTPHQKAKAAAAEAGEGDEIPF